jgi:hypothetical protein
MLNTEKFITKIRDTIIAETSFTTCFTPDLPQDGDNLCAVTLLTGNSINDLGNNNEYNTLTFRVLIRGTQNDTTTRALADEVFNKLHLLKNISYIGGYIINIVANNTPIYVGRDENQRILYNITFNSLVK